MNSIKLSENIKILEDTIRDFCNDESIDYDNYKQQLFQSILNSYNSDIKNDIDMKNMNMYVLQTFVSSLNSNNTNNTNNINNHVVKTSINKPQEIYSRDDIANARNAEFQSRFQNAQDDFANFSLKKPEEIDFSDKVNDDDISIDQKIEMEMKKRQYDLQNINMESHSEDTALTWINGVSTNNVEKSDQNNKTTNKNVTFNIKDEFIDKPQNSFFNKLKKNTYTVTDNNTITQSIDNINLQHINELKNDVLTIKQELILLREDLNNKFNIILNKINHINTYSYNGNDNSMNTIE